MKFVKWKNALALPALGAFNASAGDLPGLEKLAEGNRRYASGQAGHLRQDKVRQAEVAVRANVKGIVEKLKASNPVLAPLVQTGELQIAGARYDLGSGEVKSFH